MAAFVRRTDPQAADAILAVAQMEGWGGGIGDGGTAYGPWQDHMTDGRLARWSGRGPNDAEVQDWAWSQEGASYVIGDMHRDVPGLDSMPPAMQVDNIVRRFERPANPNAEVSGALSRLGGSTPTGGRGPRPSSGGGGGIGGFFGGLGHDVASPFESLWSSTAGAVGDVVGFLKLAAWLVNPLTWLRAVEGLFGFVLMLAGLYFIAGAASDVSASEVAKIPGVLPSAKVAKAVGGKALAKRAAQRKRQVGPTQRQVERRARRDARRDGFTPKVDVSRPLRRKHVDDDIPF